MLSSPRSSTSSDEDAIERPAKRPKRSALKASAPPRREVGLMRKNADDNYASFLGSASGIHFIRSVYTAIGDRDTPQDQTPGSNLVPGEEDRLSSDTNGSFDAYLWNSVEVANHGDSQTQFTFEDMLAWSQSYFDNWHRAYPFLHAPSVLAIFEQLCHGRHVSDHQDQDQDQVAIEMAIVRSIISITLADQRQLGKLHTPVPSTLVFKSFKHAVDSIQLVLSTKTTTVSLQAVVCVQLFLISLLRHNAASRLGGLVTRMAYNLGLHRCPVRYAAFSVSEIQLRQRLFWSIYCIDRYICQSLGLPLTLRDDDIDVCFLDHERHSKNDDGAAVLDERLGLLNLLSKQSEIKGLIMESLHKSIPYRQANEQRSEVIKMKLAKWSNDVEAYLDPERETMNPPSVLHRMMLGVLKHECVIALHRPLLAARRKDFQYGAALHTCVAAARSVVTVMHDYLEGKSENSRGLEGLHAAPLLWPSFTWAIWMSTFILIYAGVEGDIEAQVASRLTDRSLQVLKHLSKRGSVWPNACEVAIRELRSRLSKVKEADHALPRHKDLKTSPQASAHTWRYAKQNNLGRNDSLNDEPPEPVHSDHNLPDEHDSPVYVVSDARLSQQSRPQNLPRGSFTSAPRSVPPLSNQTPEASQYHYGGKDSPARNESPQNPTPGFAAASRPATRPFWPSNSDPVSSWLGQSVLPAVDSVDLFQGFEIPFWMGDDQYTNLMGA